MKDKRDELIPEQLSGYTWELSGYAPKVPFSNSDSLTCLLYTSDAADD